MKRGRGLIYLPPLSENGQAFCSLPVTKTQPVFLPREAGCIPHRTPLPPSAAPAGITHYTLQARPCAKGEAQPPFGNPPVLSWCAHSPHFCARVPTPPKPKEAAQASPPHGLICAASLFGLRAGTGVFAGAMEAQKLYSLYSVLLLQIMSYCGIIIVTDRGRFFENSCGTNTEPAGECEAVTGENGCNRGGEAVQPKPL